jgi:ribosomal-protein-alanine N-acetyltransferase
MQETDLGAVAAIEAATQITPWSLTLFRDCLESGYLCQVLRHQHASNEKQVVAFQVISSVLDECHLMNIAVAPAFQGKGLGRAMLVEALAQARQRGASVIFLEVRSSNLHAQALYSSLGFKQYDVRHHYYRSPKGREDACLMQYLF